MQSEPQEVGRKLRPYLEGILFAAVCVVVEHVTTVLVFGDI